MKIFETAEEIKDLAYDKFEETGLSSLGINLKVMSVTSAKEVLKVSRANATTEFLTNDRDIVTLFVFEEAFDKLSDEQKSVLMEGVLSNVSFDTEKDKLNVDSTRYGELIRMRKKYANYCDTIETSIMMIEELAEEERQRKEEEKLNKKSKKNG